MTIFWLGTTGGFGLVILLAVVSFAVIGFFLREPASESAWHRLIAPGLSGVILTVMVWLAIRKYATLLGVPPGSAAARWLPAVYGVAAVVGLLWAGNRTSRQRVPTLRKTCCPVRPVTPKEFAHVRSAGDRRTLPRGSSGAGFLAGTLPNTPAHQRREGDAV